MIQIIVGLDPGTTVGIAILDFNGKVLLLESRKGMGLKEVVRTISNICEPTIMATDKAEVPNLIRRVASSFGAIVFSPREDIPVDTKKALAKPYKYSNDHERDALASALYAYNHLEPKIRKIKADIRRKENEIISKVLKGEMLAKALKEKEKKEEGKVSIQEELSRLKKEIEKEKRLIKELKNKLKQKPKVVPARDLEKPKVEMNVLNNRIKELERENAKLKTQMEKISRMLSELESGEIKIFSEKLPSGYIPIERVGNIIFAREKTKMKKLSKKDLEQIIEEYRKRRG